VDMKAVLQSIIEELSFRDWRFVLDVNDGNYYLHVEFDAPDAHTGMMTPQRGRRWILEPGIDRGQVVQTALMAVLAAVEHEAREDFRYRSQPVYGPHADVEALHELTSRRQA
jgi:hypothetical protein